MHEYLFFITFVLTLLFMIHNFKTFSMIRKLLLTTAIILTGFTLLNAQCTPGSYTAEGIYPDTVTNLPRAYVTFPYNTTVTCVIPTDTVSIVTWTVDSIGITSITGMPAGFTYTPNKVSGYWPGGGKGCILISGTATAGEVGIHKLKIYTKTYVSNTFLGSQTEVDTVMGYKIDIQDSSLAGVNIVNDPDGVSILVISDLFCNTVNVKINSPSAIKDASFIINDITGREIMRVNNLNCNDFMINRDKLSNGIYIVSLINGQKIIARKKVFIE